MSVDDGAEAVELRRLLKDKTEQALQLAMELELQRRQAKELGDQLNQLVAVAGDVCDLVGVTGKELMHELLKQTIPIIEKAQELYRERAARILHVFGCMSCGGEHRGIWTQELKPPVQHRDLGFQVFTCQRAYVCPSVPRVVLVSNESEETFVAELTDG